MLGKKEFNKTIWMYWDQGFDQAPELVKKCSKSWVDKNPDWDIRFLDSSNLSIYISKIPVSESKLEKLNLPHKSDLIRTQLLLDFGGVWADPTSFCVQPLEDWLPEYFTSGIFLFYKPGKDRIISNWFIAAEKNNPLLKAFYKQLCSYWEDNSFLNYHNKKVWYESIVKKVYNRNHWSTQFWFNIFTLKILRIFPYMVYHYMFYQLVSNDKEAKDIWEATPKLYSSGPHSLQRIGLVNAINNEIKLEIDGRVEPLYKLTWKMKNKSIPEGSVLEYLLNSND